MTGGEILVVGAGPGDPGLLTLKAKKALSQANVIVYDAAIHSNLFFYSKPEAKWILLPNEDKEQVEEIIERSSGYVLFLLPGEPSQEYLRRLFDGMAYTLIPGVRRKAPREKVPRRVLVLRSTEQAQEMEEQLYAL